MPTISAFYGIVIQILAPDAMHEQIAQHGEYTLR